MRKPVSKKPARRYHVQVWLSPYCMRATDDEWAVSKAQAISRFAWRLRNDSVFVDIAKFEAWEVTP